MRLGWLASSILKSYHGDGAYEEQNPQAGRTIHIYHSQPQPLPSLSKSPSLVPQNPTVPRLLVATMPQSREPSDL